MTRAPRRRARGLDPRQLQFLSKLNAELVSVPAEPADAPASHDHDQRVRRWLNEAIDQSGLPRDQIADAMTALAGREITKPMIDSWTGAARPNRFPFDLVSAFCLAVGNNHVMTKTAERMGMRLADTLEAQLARLGQWSLVIAYAQDQQRALVAGMPPLPLFARAP